MVVQTYKHSFFQIIGCAESFYTLKEIWISKIICIEMETTMEEVDQIAMRGNS